MSTLWLVATPIGNLEDITLRALRLLGEVDALACEDTRVTRRIFARHGIKSPAEIFSCHEHNERSAAERIIRLLAAGKTVALCTDAGMPAISDPGFRLVAAVLEAGFNVGIAPGPSAVETALALSGLPTSSYLFKGFPPRKPGRLKAFLAAERDRPHTMVFFESPYRLGRFLAAALEILGERRAAVCLELTKKFERVERGPLSRLTAFFAEQKIKGEATVVIEGCRRAAAAEDMSGEDER
ncbi:MAG: 16S rRNA (cytidine(1402)-2'-O)-methyltransferase [Planctomycetota bacterium]|nr:16S rRNA (cytidine(1402)-2'-O)-methyltransferase [Planctomycetota bacterium]